MEIELGEEELAQYKLVAAVDVTNRVVQYEDQIPEISIPTNIVQSFQLSHNTSSF